jgi:hypothetical protein
MFSLSNNSEPEKMKQYLLGALPPESLTTFEERLLRDGDFYEQLLIAEDNLVDDYLADRLSEPDREGFESYFTIAPERQQKVRFGKALRRYILAEGAKVSQPELSQGASAADKSSRSKPGFVLWPFKLRPVLGLSFIITACLVLFAVSWMVFRRPSFPATVTKLGQKSTVIALVSGSTRSEGVTQRVSIPPGVDSVQLQLELKRNDYQTYRAELLADTSVLATGEPLKPEVNGSRSVVYLAIPADVLKPGDYQVRLSGISNYDGVEVVDRYPFRVVTH